MAAYHQMGNDSRNLLGILSGYSGAIVSPVNEVEEDVVSMISEHASATFDFIFDPQLYFPRRSDRGKLSTWDYFPKDIDTADISSTAWWDELITKVINAAVRVGAKHVCSPAMAGSLFSNDYYDAMRNHADKLAQYSKDKGIRPIQTVLVRLSDLETSNRIFEIASIVSNTKAQSIYLLLLSDIKPREELRNEEQLKAVMKLIRMLEDAGLPVLVGCSSSDVVLWKAAGASSCATGKFANLRRFTEGRFNEPEDGGRQIAYWFEESLLAFIRTTDIVRIQPVALLNTVNTYGEKILEQLVAEPSKPWVGLGWRQYMQWFADVERRLTAGETAARSLIRSAEQNWQLVEKNDIFMEEARNDGSWLRPWLRAVVEFNK